MPTVVVLIHGGALSIERIKEQVRFVIIKNKDRCVDLFRILIYHWPLDIISVSLLFKSPRSLTYDFSFHCLISPQADAILDAHYPGAATGAAAVADTLYGLNNPSGKLTYSVMPALFANLSNFASMSMTAPPGRGYRYYPTSPSTMPPVLWPFGFGLSYTDFALECTSSSTSMGTAVDRSGGGNGGNGGGSGGGGGAGGGATVTCVVTNVGKMDGAEVVQLYHIPPANSTIVTGALSPRRVLIDYKRVNVEAAAAVTVTFDAVTQAQLELPTKAGGRVLVGGHTQMLMASRGHGEEVTVWVTVDGEEEEGRR